MLKWLPSIITSRIIPTLSTMATIGQYTSAASRLQFLDRSTGKPGLAYRKTAGSKSPGVMFLPGFMSNMNGGKALALEAYCEQHGHPYIRFDNQGLGESRGDIGDILSSRAFDVWVADAQDVLDQLTTGPQILVGSSMGGAIMLLLAMNNPSRVQALIGVSTAVLFDKPLSYSEEKIPAEAAAGEETTATHKSYVTPKAFLSKELQHRLMAESLPITQPVRLIHGMLDDTVPYQSAIDLVPRLHSRDVEVVLRKDGKHRMSEPQDLKLLIQCLDDVISLKHCSNKLDKNKL